MRHLHRIILLGLLLTLPIAAAQDRALTYDDMIQESLRLRNAGDFAAAEAILREAAPLARETNEVDLLLGLVIAFQERYLEANRILAAAREKYPDDEQLILGQARVLSYQGFYNESLEIADSALQLDPGNTEALNLKARVYFYQRRYNNSREEFTRVLALDPDNLEAWIGLHDVEQVAGNDDAAESALARAALLEPGHVDVVRRQQNDTLAVAAQQELIAGYSRSDIDRLGLRRWYDRSLEYRYRGSSGDEFYLRGQHAHRFGLHDSMVEIGSVFANKRRRFELSVGYTPDDEILPQYRVRIGTEFLLRQASENFGSTTLGVGFVSSQYDTGKVQWLQLDFTHYLLGTNAWITPGLDIVRDETGTQTVGWELGAHWQVRSRLLAGFTYTDAPETELGITTETTSRHLYLRYSLFDSASVRLDLSRIDRKNSYMREEIAVSLQYRF